MAEARVDALRKAYIEWAMNTEPVSISPQVSSQEAFEAGFKAGWKARRVAQDRAINWHKSFDSNKEG